MKKRNLHARFPFRARRGLTLIEVIVAITIIGLLIAILIPAVQSAREASRRIQCAANLRQLGLAINQYASAFGVLPARSNSRGYSLYAVILPYLEQRPLYDAINFSFPTSLLRPEDTAMRMSLAVLLCPSDPWAPRFAGSTCYAGNQGVGFCKGGLYGTCDNGVFVWPSPIGFQAITDGTSSTAMIAEWMVSSGWVRVSGSDPRSWVYSIPGRFNEPGQFNLFATKCRDADAGLAARGIGKGREWLSSGYPYTTYNHIEKINGHSCLNNGQENGGSVQDGAWTAGSMHVRGANVLFADGHVRFLSDSIAIEVWRGLGTRNGQEAISSDSF